MIEVVGLIAALVLLAIWVCYKKITDVGPPVDIITGDFTALQLKEFNGIQKPQVFISIQGYIYDVSSSWFYRKNGPYSKFAGNQISINLGKMSQQASYFNKWKKVSLTAQQQKKLQEWTAKIDKKYRKVGKLLDATQKQ